MPKDKDVVHMMSQYYAGINKQLSTTKFGLSFEPNHAGYGGDKYTVQFNVNVLVLNDESELETTKNDLGDRFSGVILFLENLSIFKKNHIDLMNLVRGDISAAKEVDMMCF